jgi:hypothetical protein
VAPFRPLSSFGNQPVSPNYSLSVHYDVRHADISFGTPEARLVAKDVRRNCSISLHLMPLRELFCR